MTLFSQPIVVLDVESSGLQRQPWASVIELAAVLVDIEGDEVDAFQALVHPAKELPLEADAALAISGITRDMLATAPSIEWVLSDWADWFIGHGRPYCASYNEEFDRFMIERRLGVPALPWARCIMQAATELMGPAGVLRDADPTHPRFDPDRPWLWPSLTGKPDKQGVWHDGAAEFFGVQHAPQDHRALADARIAVDVMKQIRRRQLESKAA